MLADHNEKWIDDSKYQMAPCCWGRPNSDLIFFERAIADEAKAQDEVEESSVEAL